MSNGLADLRDIAFSLVKIELIEAGGEVWWINGILVIVLRRFGDISGRWRR